MHIPDGFLDTKTWATLNGVSLSAISIAVYKTKKIIGEKQVPLMGVMAAFIFAAQMLNFPVAGGTSGHFMGGVLASIMLGPLTGILIMTTVLVVQCLIFQDGGLTVLGANIFNMGIIGSLAGYYIYNLLNKLIKKFESPQGVNLVNAFIASWLSIVLASIVCSIELAISKTVPLNIVLPAMAGVHALIGIGEGLITALVLGFILKTRPDLFQIEKV